MAEETYLEVTESTPRFAHLTIIGREHSQDDGGRRDEEVGSIFVQIRKGSVGIEVIRQDESWVGPIETRLR